MGHMREGGEIKAIVDFAPRVQERGNLAGSIKREMSARERENACRRFEWNISKFESQIEALRIQQRQIDAQIASIERALAAMKAPLVRLKAVRLREAVTGNSPLLSAEEQKNLFSALFDGLREAARFVRRNVRDLAEGLYGLTDAIATGTGSSHTAQISRKIGELESRLADLKRERERIDTKIQDLHDRINDAIELSRNIGCFRR